LVDDGSEYQARIVLVRCPNKLGEYIHHVFFNAATQ
jgi:hypothetical protein